MSSRRIGVLSLVVTVTVCGCNAKLGHWDGDYPVIEPSPNAAQGGALAVSDPALVAPGTAPSNAAPSPASAPPPWTAPLPPGAVCAQAVPMPECKLPNGVMLPSDAFAAEKNVLNDFAGGVALPPGRYRLEYIDGCIAFGLDRPTLDGIASIKPIVISLGAMPADLQAFDAALNLAQLWTVSFTIGSPDVTVGTAAIWITRDGVDYMPAPGAQYPAIFTTYGDCVQANCIAANRIADFAFEGGVMGIRYSTTGAYTGVAESLLHFSAAAVGGRSPTYRLTRLDPCP